MGLISLAGAAGPGRTPVRWLQEACERHAAAEPLNSAGPGARAGDSMWTGIAVTVGTASSGHEGERGSGGATGAKN